MHILSRFQCYRVFFAHLGFVWSDAVLLTFIRNDEAKKWFNNKVSRGLLSALLMKKMNGSWSIDIKNFECLTTYPWVLLIRLGPVHKVRQHFLGGGGALCFEWGFTRTFSWESRCCSEIKIWAHCYQILVVFYYPCRPQADLSHTHNSINS